MFEESVFVESAFGECVFGEYLIAEDFGSDSSTFPFFRSNTIPYIIMLDLCFIWMDLQTNFCCIEVEINEHRLDL